jgi:hypothetical protein
MMLLRHDAIESDDRMINECGAGGEKENRQGKSKFLEKTRPIPLQIQHDLTFERSRSNAVGSLRLIVLSYGTASFNSDAAL